VSAEVDKVVRAMPGSLPELVEKTGYPTRAVLGIIVKARIAGHRITVKQVDGVSVFEVQTNG
jgi:hypothetical protein